MAANQASLTYTPGADRLRFGLVPIRVPPGGPKGLLDDVGPPPADETLGLVQSQNPGPVQGGILTRRSRRLDYDRERAVSRDILERIVQCGLAAPSSKNSQPWRFHVVTDRSILATVADAARNAPGADRYVPMDPLTGEPTAYASTVRESADVLASVPAAVFVESTGPFSGGRQTLATAVQNGWVDTLFGFMLESMGLGAAVQNMYLAAGELGLSCACMGDIAIAHGTVRDLLPHFTEDFVVVLALGYSTEVLPPRGLTIDPVDNERVFWS